MTTKAATEKQEAIDQLRKWLKPGDTVYTILRHVSRSGMQRKVGVVLIQQTPTENIDLHPNWSVAKATGYRLNRGGANDALIVNGCGMDMGFDVVYNLSHVLYGAGYQCIGEDRRCPGSSHQYRGEHFRKYGPEITHKDGYALRHRWL